MNNEPIKDDIVLNDDELVCILTETRKKQHPKNWCSSLSFNR